jgi:hypothetical protein
LILSAAIALAVAAAPAPTPSRASAHPSRPTIAVTPARLALAGASSAAVHVISAETAIVDAQATGLAVDLRGRPHIASAGDAAAWLQISPRHFTVRRVGGAGITVTAKPPPGARPGDHLALLLLTTRPTAASGVAVRVRIGIVVTVRVPGRLVRRLALGPVRLRRRGRDRIVEVDLLNRGNVTERLARGRFVVTMLVRGRVLARLRSAPRELWPRRSRLSRQGARLGSRADQSRPAPRGRTPAPAADPPEALIRRAPRWRSRRRG